MGKWYHLQVGDHFPINHLRTPAAAAARHRFDADLHLGFTNPPTHKHTTTLNSTCADDGVVIGLVASHVGLARVTSCCFVKRRRDQILLQFAPLVRVLLISLGHILLPMGTCKYLVVVSLRRWIKKLKDYLVCQLGVMADLVAEVLFEAKQILQFWQLSNLGSSSWTSSGNVITSLLSRLLRCLTLFFNYRLPWFSGSRYFNLP